MNLHHLAVLARALADKAEELAAEQEASALERRQQAQAARETSKGEMVADDLNQVVSLVAKQPGLSASEIQAALQSDGFSQARATTALSKAKQVGRVTTSREGSKFLHYVANTKGGES